jgi:rubrerythrin
MATLVGIARAIESEAVRRYTLLAELMDRRGEPATAAAFRTMLEEERHHVEAVDRWAALVDVPAPAPGRVGWHLPADLASSWDEITGSVLLTPYRAFAVAVENEQRAFALYAYLAAHADNAQVRAEAEKLGAEELRHAALFRRWRRRAYHRERRIPRHDPQQIDSVGMLGDLLARHEAAIASTHLALAARLRRAGDEANAQLLERCIPTTARAAVPQGTSRAAPAVADTDPVSDGDDTRHLLIDAQKPLEALADVLETVMATADGELFEQAATAMDAVVKRIARISLQIRSSSEA